MSAASKKHMARVRDMGCIVCRRIGLGASAASAHHINARAAGMKECDENTISLCPIHHQFTAGLNPLKPGMVPSVSCWSRRGGSLATYQSRRRFRSQQS